MTIFYIDESHILSLDFAKKSGSSGKEKNCVKGYACKLSCINRNRECKDPLEGQGKNYAEYLKIQQAKLSAPTKKKSDKPKQAKKEDATQPSQKADSGNQSGSSTKFDLVAPPYNKTDLKKLTKEIDSLFEESQSLLSEDPATYGDNVSVLRTIRVSAKGYAPETFRGLRDKNGNMQAQAIVKEEDDSLYLEYLATATWNVKGDDPRKTKGAGSEMIAQIIQESAKKGKGGRISLEALPGAESFYKKIGFKPKGKRVPDELLQMELDTNAARAFLQNRGITPEFAAVNQTFQDELDELELLANGAFAANGKVFMRSSRVANEG